MVHRQKVLISGHWPWRLDIIGVWHCNTSQMRLRDSTAKFFARVFIDNANFCRSCSNSRPTHWIIVQFSLESWALTVLTLENYLNCLREKNAYKWLCAHLKNTWEHTTIEQLRRWLSKSNQITKKDLYLSRLVHQETNHWISLGYLRQVPNN